MAKYLIFIFEECNKIPKVMKVNLKVMKYLDSVLENSSRLYKLLKYLLIK